MCLQRFNFIKRSDGHFAIRARNCLQHEDEADEEAQRPRRAVHQQQLGAAGLRNTSRRVGAGRQGAF
ncbi:hypothetical protein GQ600_26662 [Phytophthora cactorum]|nr:hypothetical protein GQ600_26662 [Phytophthora cactorum]